MSELWMVMPIPGKYPDDAEELIQAVNEEDAAREYLQQRYGDYDQHQLPDEVNLLIVPVGVMYSGTYKLTASKTLEIETQ